MIVMMLVMFLVFISVFATLRVAFVVLREAQEESGASYLAKNSNALTDKLLSVSPARVYLLGLIAGIVSGVLLHWLWNRMFLSLMFFALSPILSYFVVNWLRAKRKKDFERQFPDTLSVFASSLRAGLALPNAIANSVEQTSPPMSQELAVLRADLAMGKNARAYQALAERMPLRSVNLFVAAVITCQRTGGNLTEMTDSISSTIRQSIQQDNELSALTADGRFQGYVMAAAPFVMAFVLYYINRDMIVPLITTWIGNVLIALVIVLEVIGALVIRRILKIREED